MSHVKIWNTWNKLYCLVCTKSNSISIKVKFKLHGIDVKDPGVFEAAFDKKYFDALVRFVRLIVPGLSPLMHTLSPGWIMVKSSGFALRSSWSANLGPDSLEIVCFSRWTHHGYSAKIQRVPSLLSYFKLDQHISLSQCRCHRGRGYTSSNFKDYLNSSENQLSIN